MHNDLIWTHVRGRNFQIETYPWHLRSLSWAEANVHPPLTYKLLKNALSRPPTSPLRTHQNKDLLFTKQGVAIAPWVHHWTRMRSTEEIQTFPNLSLNKLALLKAADRPFIVAGTGPMACTDRPAALWFSVLAAMTDELQRGWRRRSLSPPQGFTSLPTSSTTLVTASRTLREPCRRKWKRAGHRESWQFWHHQWWAVLKTKIFCKLSLILSWWNDKRAAVVRKYFYNSTDWSKRQVSKEDFSRIWRLQVRIKKTPRASFLKFSSELEGGVSDTQRMSKLKSWRFNFQSKPRRIYLL